ncbi:MAG: Methionyl-tRNA formyltransferase [Candidatus Nomurabacteria bacterium GW2011_GWF2_43_8]|uniref:Methionyl-tRNA formyltransferase n=3 Tax=Candidatus Nomuraibacteriota TaxID=1752729 RepID=A0A0G1FSW7_9BACT|nr:MAG: Methionyl-tRNA formyltransferase [Candidatus Nomurabacteria bacterium GW2011_GWA2_43_15]KKT18757.1 MAG: Methionyl-tRNA formyltransferase [Candidatus Nomurabacteria bacterium GW2011_GWB1_43_7]KKT25128.1 MAG: Methionyl-tRNA formyltransferase [Candidatus Nomurabacteria bacterium GW2011_GWF2_43_8]
MSKLNFVFFGTPEVASETLEILKRSGFTPSLIVTSPDKPQGRKMLVTPPPVKVWAEENGIPYIQPETLGKLEIVLRTSAQAGEPSKAIRQQANTRGEQNNFQFDLFVIVAYGKILPESILNMPKLGSINIHYSLLPKYRGASPVESAILNGETETGVTIQKMAYKMDSGPILAQEKVEIFSNEKAPDLRGRLIKIGGELLVKILKTPSVSGHFPFAGGEEQDESQATFCKKIKKEDGLIDLDDDPVKNYNKFRAYAEWPRTFFFRNGKRIIITDAILDNGQFVLKKVIPEGKREINWEKLIK